MKMTPRRRWPTDLATATAALEIGNWPVLEPAVMAGLVGTSTETALATLQLIVADAMNQQVTGEIGRAADALDEAAACLPRAYHHCRHGRWYAVLTPAPSGGLALDVLVWRMACVIVREQAGLEEHRAALRAGPATSREALVLAYVEHLRWIECDDFLLAVDVDLPGDIIEVRPAALCRRATALWRLAEPTIADVDTAVLRRMGGSRIVRSLALAELGARPLVPAAGPGALPIELPVRRARVAACERGRRYWTDLGAA